MIRRILLLMPVLCLAFLTGRAGTQEKSGVLDVLAVIKDSRGEVTEGYLRLSSEEVTVFTKDHQEKRIPPRYIKSITLEKVREEDSAKDPKQEARYSVRVENSQEIYTLKKKYTFSLNTNLGVVTKSIDPETINNLLSKDGSPALKSDRDKPWIQDKSVVFSLEFKF